MGSKLEKASALSSQRLTTRGGSCMLLVVCTSRGGIVVLL